MTTPEQNKPEPTVLPGYFSPAEAPKYQRPAPQIPGEQALTRQDAPYQPQPYPGVPYAGAPYPGVSMPAPVNPYVAPALQFGPSSPVSLPLYSATPVQAVGRFFGKYATFSGRASRSEFWWVQLFMAAVFIVAAVLNSSTNDLAVGVYLFFMLGCIVPGLALTVRRLHDANLQGALSALVLVPYAGLLIVGVLALLGPKAQGARFDKRQITGPQNQAGPYGYRG